MDDDVTTRVQVLYRQLCSRHDGIAEFRAKLLALLPMASGAGISLLIGRDQILKIAPPYLVAAGLFGLAMTVGLYFYELRGIQECNTLIKAGRIIEENLSNAFYGAFRSRPSKIWHVGTTEAALIIYPAVGGAWTYVGTQGIASLTINTFGCLLISMAVAGAGAVVGWAVLNAADTR